MVGGGWQEEVGSGRGRGSGGWWVVVEEEENAVCRGFKSHPK